MLKQYKHISIIYGNTGRACAKHLAECIETLHFEEGFPVKTHLLADEVLNSGTILDTIKDLILSSEACIIILTFDDVNNSRVRQNVLVEIGMASSCIDRDKCFYLSEKVPLPNDFPSDISSSVNPNYFDKNNLGEVFKRLKPVICKQLKLKSNKGLLTEDYEYDYKKVLNDIPATIFNEVAEDQLNSILIKWTDNIIAFDFVSERLMYLAERISFFPNFKNNEVFFRCLKEIDSAIKPSEIDYSFYDRKYLRAVCKLFKNIIKYTVEKMKPTALAGSENLTIVQSYQLYDLFSHIAEDINSFLEAIEKNPDWHYTGLIELLAYDYAALAKLKSLNYKDSITIEDLHSIEKCFIKVVKLANNEESDELWKGYAFFNLARLYEKMYRLTKEGIYIQKLKSAIRETLFFRHEWLDVDFEGAFGTALTFEYFLASKYDYEIRYYLGTNDEEIEEPDYIIKGLKSLRNELSEYCETIDVGRLFEMRDSIDCLIDKISEKEKR